MKKLLLLAAVAGLSMTSCKKDYTCECTTTTTGGGFNSTGTASATIKDTKKKAKESCENGTKAASTTLGVTTEVKCVIK